MAHLIFGSNEQEEVGMGLDTTINLCRQVFAGHEVDPADVDTGSIEYQDQIRKLIEGGIETHPDREHVIRSRREVIQHAQALRHITNVALTRDEPHTEDLLKQTHRVLCQGLTLQIDNDTSWAGVYRNTFVRAGETHFCEPSMVPHYMKRFVEAFNEDVRKGEDDQELDPFFLAADICQDFVTIHPLKDGNGRMCRLLANAYLIKYAGIMISIGKHDEDRKAYLKLAELAGAGETEEEARGNLATFFLSKTNPTLGRLRANLEGGNNSVL